MIPIFRFLAIILCAIGAWLLFIFIVQALINLGSADGDQFMASMILLTVGAGFGWGADYAQEERELRDARIRQRFQARGAEMRGRVR